MSQYLNSNAKGQFFPSVPGSFNQAFINDPTWLISTNTADWTWPSPNTATQWSAADALGQLIRQFEVVLYGVLEMKTDNMQHLIDKTNNRIYGEL
jgi:hypothetical protein